MIPVLSNVAGAAQAQRHNAFNQAKANEDAKAAAARAVRDRLMLGLVDAGVNAAMQFGGKAYDEATTGARDAQRLKSDLDQRERANVLDLAERNMDQLGYKTDPVPNAGYGMETETGKGRMGRIGPDSGPSAAEGSPITREMGPGPSAPGTLRAPTPDEAMGGLSPLQRAAQTTLLRNRQAAQDQAIAAAQAAAQKRADTLAKEEEANRFKSYELIARLLTATQQRYGAKGRPANAPQFGVQPEVDERGIVRPRFTEPMKPAPMPGGGGGRAPSGYTGMLGEVTTYIIKPEPRRDGLAASPRVSYDAIGRWTDEVIAGNAARTGLSPEQKGRVAALKRIVAANETANPQVAADAVSELKAIQAEAKVRLSPTIAESREGLVTSPADAARQAKADAERDRAARERAAKATDDNAKRSGAIDLVGVEARQAVADIEAKAAAEMAKDVSGTKRETVAGLVGADIAAAMNGEPPRAGLTPDQVRAWQTMTARGAQIRTAKDAAIRLAKAKTAAKLKALGVDVEE